MIVHVTLENPREERGKDSDRKTVGSEAWMWLENASRINGWYVWQATRRISIMLEVSYDDVDDDRCRAGDRQTDGCDENKARCDESGKEDEEQRADHQRTMGIGWKLKSFLRGS